MPEARGARTRLHLAFTLLVVVALVVAVAATLIAGRLQQLGTGDQPGTLTTSLQISTLSNGQMACPYDAAFSPDGTRIAVLGTLDTCPAPVRNDAGDPQQNVAAVYDSATGALVRLYQLDVLLGSGQARLAARVSRVAYAGLGWSPDGTRIAFSFTQFGGVGRRQTENLLNSGLLTINIFSGTAVVLRGDSGFFATANGASSGFPLWLIADGTALPPFLPQPGLAYAWDRNGVPIPGQPLPLAGSRLPDEIGQRYPVGNPGSDPRFTIWQPGVVLGPGSVDQGGKLSAFVTAFPAWSPDGGRATLMVAGITLATPLVSSGPTVKNVARPAFPFPPTLPVAPARDVALEEVQQDVGDRGWALVAWNPAGTLLGSVNCSASRDIALEVRDTAAGGVVGRAPLPFASNGSGCGGGTDDRARGAYPDLHIELCWSPSGDSLLVTNRDAGTLTAWKVPQAPGR